MSDDNRVRCPWVDDSEIYIRYHDEEWGRPVRDDRALFEKLILEGFQAGLSWITILRKRENFRQAFDGFNPAIIAAYDDRKVEELLQNAGIVRSRQKIKGAITNAQVYLEHFGEPWSFSEFLWSFVDGQPIINRYATLEDVPAKTERSLQMAKALKKRGFTYVGGTISYAFMQSMGLVVDHTTDCFLHPDNAGN